MMAQIAARNLGGRDGILKNRVRSSGDQSAGLLNQLITITHRMLQVTGERGDRQNSVFRTASIELTLSIES